MLMSTFPLSTPIIFAQAHVHLLLSKAPLDYIFEGTASYTAHTCWWLRAFGIQHSYFINKIQFSPQHHLAIYISSQACSHFSLKVIFVTLQVHPFFIMGKFLLGYPSWKFFCRLMKYLILVVDSLLG